MLYLLDAAEICTLHTGFLRYGYSGQLDSTVCCCSMVSSMYLAFTLVSPDIVVMVAVVVRKSGMVVILSLTSIPIPLQILSGLKFPNETS